MALQAESAAPAAALAAQSCEGRGGSLQEADAGCALLEDNVCDAGGARIDQTIENL